MKKISLLLLVGLLALLAACQPAATTAPPTSAPATSAPVATTAGAATTAATTGAVQPQPTAAVATATSKPTAQVMRLNLGNEPDTIDPQKASFVGEISVIMKVFSNLLTFDSNGQLIPEMAAAMPTTSADGKTITFKLKPGLKYSDGKALTAKDFEYGWKRHLDPNVAGEYAFTGYIIKGGEDYNSADP